MGRAYSDITFTPAVRQVQTEQGSREQYAFLDAMADRGDVLTPREMQLIREADHFFQATVSETGWPYVQHRGGPAGFLKVLDPKTLGFADYRGNLHYLSVGNLRGDDRISIIVVDHANRRRLKLVGRVRLVDAKEDPATVAAVRDEGHHAVVERAFIITVEGWDWNCPTYITTRFTETEVTSLLSPLREQVKKLRAQLAAAKPAGPQTLGDGPLALRIAGVRQLTPAIRGYELMSADGAPLPHVEAGSHLDVPVRLADGTAATRSYSISSSPLRRDAYEIAVLREDEGKGGSLAAHRDFVLGQQLNCSMPRNAFALEARPHKAVLVAGGIGITPIKAMAHALAARGEDFELHYACRSRGQAAFLGELLDAFGARVIVHAKDEGGRLDVAALTTQLGGTEQVYACGPARLIAALEASVPADRLHVERFAASAPRSGDREFIVHMVRSGRDLVVPAGRSIVEALEAEGGSMPASCRAGTCGTCATRVIDGAVDHRDQVLTEAERTEQRLMCACVSRAEGSAITLDL